MDRREFVITSGIAAASGLIGSAAMAEGKDHKHMDHGMPKARTVSKELKELRDSTYECKKVGEICLALCNDVLAGGSTSMADCQSSVLNMLAVVEAMSKTATYNSVDSKLIKSLARTCAEFCRSCEKECKTHSEMHAECKNCMDACIRCAKACDAYAKA
jgi:Cys-rich four helix bundle protein (predicted Tat secretion target)